MYSQRVVFRLMLILGFILILGSLAQAGMTPLKEILVRFKSNVDASQVDSLSAALGLHRVRSYDEIKVDVFEVASHRSVSEVVQLCSNVPFVEYVEPTAMARAFSPEEAHAESPLPTQAQVADFKPGEVLIKFKSTVGQPQITSVLTTAGIQITQAFNEVSVYLCRITDNESVLKTIEQCQASPDVEYAEPNYIYKASVTPNDPRFSQLFGMTITEADKAWDIQTGSKSVIVGVIDTGVDHGHEDLAANIWHNPGESGGGKENNNIDDDGNGFVDDFRGWDFINNDNDPFDDNQHGTHVSGTIGAVGNNGKGVVGVNWSVSIMPLKFLSRDGSGTTDDAVQAIIYATQMGAKVLSNSWGGGGRSQALEDAIRFANNHGVLFVAAAGNESNDNDRFPTYPANYEVDNVISVASSTSSDRLSGFSNFGKTTVDLAAPGSSILSTLPRDRYGSLSGTSMATPHVSGAAALVWAQFPALTMREVKIRVLGGVDRLASFANEVATGGRLNVRKALSTDPIIANTTRLENTLDETGPYRVESDILDDSAIQSATLTYQVMGQDAVTVNMTDAGDHHYFGEIPGQPLGSTITYFVAARDDAGNLSKDANFTFSIAEPSNGGGCCGKPAVEVALGSPVLEKTVGAALNLAFFVLPVALVGVVSRRKKK